MSPAGSFAIENNGTPLATNAVTGGPFTSWFLQGTVLRLYDTNTGPANLETKAVVQADCSYVFENMAWRGQLSGLGTNGPAPGSGAYLAWVAATNFTSLANAFTNASANNPKTLAGLPGGYPLGGLGRLLFLHKRLQCLGLRRAF